MYKYHSTDSINEIVYFSEGDSIYYFTLTKEKLLEFKRVSNAFKDTLLNIISEARFEPAPFNFPIEIAVNNYLYMRHKDQYDKFMEHQAIILEDSEKFQKALNEFKDKIPKSTDIGKKEDE